MQILYRFYFISKKGRLLGRDHFLRRFHFIIIPIKVTQRISVKKGLFLGISYFNTSIYAHVFS